MNSIPVGPRARLCATSPRTRSLDRGAGVEAGNKVASPADHLARLSIVRYPLWHQSVESVEAPVDISPDPS